MKNIANYIDSYRSRRVVSFRQTNANLFLFGLCVTRSALYAREMASFNQWHSVEFNVCILAFRLAHPSKSSRR